MVEMKISTTMFADAVKKCKYLHKSNATTVDNYKLHNLYINDGNLTVCDGRTFLTILLNCDYDKNGKTTVLSINSVKRLLENIHTNDLTVTIEDGAAYINDMFVNNDAVQEEPEDKKFFDRWAEEEYLCFSEAELKRVLEASLPVARLSIPEGKWGPLVVINFSEQADKVYVGATDGKCLAIYRCSVMYSKCSKGQVTIPVNAAHALAKLCQKDQDRLVRFSIGRKTEEGDVPLVFSGLDYTVKTTKLFTTFPDVYDFYLGRKGIITHKSESGHLRIDAAYLHKAAKRVMYKDADVSFTIAQHGCWLTNEVYQKSMEISIPAEIVQLPQSWSSNQGETIVFPADNFYMLSSICKHIKGSIDIFFKYKEPILLAEQGDNVFLAIMYRRQT